MKATEHYFHVVLFITLYKVVLTFTSVYETVVCDHSNESYWAVLSCDTVCAAQGGSTFLVWMKPKLLSSTVILLFINLPCKNRALKLVSLDNWRVAILVIPLYLLANIKGSVSNLTFPRILKIFVSFRHKLSLLPVTNAFMVYCAESNQAILFWFGFTTVWDWLSSLIGK